MLPGEAGVGNGEPAGLDLPVEIGLEPRDALPRPGFEEHLPEAWEFLRSADHHAHRRDVLRLRHQLEIALAEAPQHRGNVGILAVELEQDLGEGLLLLDRQGLEQLLLAVEVDVEGPLRDAGRPGDLAHAGAVEPLGQEDPAGAVQDLPALAALARACISGPEARSASRASISPTMCAKTHLLC